MKSFWLGLLGSFVGVMLLAAMAFYTDIFTIEKDGAPKFRVSDAGKITVGATESYVNLVIQNNGAAANNKVDVTADVLTVEGIRLENVNVSADVTASGAGGLDTGAETSNTWFYVWVITNNDGTSSNGLLSSSSTSPTLPSGFTKKRRVGAVRNNGSGNFLPYVQEGNKLIYTEGIGIHFVAQAENPPANTWTTPATPPGNFIPPTSRRGSFTLQWIGTYTVATVNVMRLRKTGASGNGTFAMHFDAPVAGATVRASSLAECDTNASQQIEYLVDLGGIASGGAYIQVIGYYDRI